MIASKIAFLFVFTDAAELKGNIVENNRHKILEPQSLR